MVLSQQAISELKDIYLQEYKIKLSNSEAQTLGLRLLKLMRQIFKPTSINQIKKWISHEFY